MEHSILKSVFDKYKTEDKETLLEIISNQEIKIREIEMLLQYRYETIQNNNKEIERPNNIINQLEKYLEQEKDRLARETSNIYENSLGEPRLVNGDIFNEIIIIQDKIKALKGDSSNGNK